MASGFININRRNQLIKIVLWVTSLMMILACTGCAKKDSAEKDALELLDVKNVCVQNSDYAIYETGDSQYMYEVYTVNGDVAYRDILYKLPQITIYEDRFVEIRWGAGTGLWLCRYYDKETHFISTALECPWYVEQGMVALAGEYDGKRQLKIFNPFSYSEYEKLIELDFYQETACASLSLLNLECIENGKIQVEYLNETGEKAEKILMYGGTTETDSEKVNAVYEGTWKIDRVVLISDMYTGTTLDGVDESDLFDSEDYIGYELEYTEQYFRLGDAMYENPQYIQSETTIDLFQKGGRYFAPTNLYALVKEEDILFDTYDDSLIEMKVEFENSVKFDTYDFIPVGTEVVFLDENTLLVGWWGKILIAYKQ